MTTEQFDALCESLYDLTPDQLGRLSGLLASRHWQYEEESHGEITLEMLHEVMPSSTIRWLTEVEIDDLACALKGCSSALRDKIQQLLPKETSASLEQKMRDLGPVRLSAKEKAEARVLAVWRRLLDEKKVVPAPVHRAVGLCPQAFGFSLDEIRRRERLVFYSRSSGDLASLQRELPPETIADMLGYLNDPRLIRRFLLSVPTQQGQIILERLLSHWPNSMNQNPESAAPNQVSLMDCLLSANSDRSNCDEGRKALTKVLATLCQLVDEGQLCR